MAGKKHWNEIDSLYAIGIILVIIGHSHSSDWSKFAGTALEWGIWYIYNFHMELFFFISGFLFLNSKALERDGYWLWILRKAERLLVPYVFWSGVALIPKYYVEHSGFSGFTGAYLLKVLINPRAGVWGHFWFLPVMFLTYAVFGFVKRFISTKNVWTFIIGSLISTTVLYFLPINTELLGLSDLRSMMLFFAFGMMAFRVISDEDLINLGRWKMVYCGASLICSIVLKEIARSNRFIGLIVALSMIITCWILGELIQDKPGVKWLSEYSFTYYIFSWFFQAVAMAICDHFSIRWITTFLIMFIAGLSGPTLVILVYQKLFVLHRHFIKLVLGIRG